jgi:hypothetical protein
VTKCTVKEAKSLVKNLVRQLGAEGFNSGVKVLKSILDMVASSSESRKYERELRISINKFF